MHINFGSRPYWVVALFALRIQYFMILVGVCVCVCAWPNQNTVALDMLLDLLTERGYNTVVDVQRVFTPVSIKEGKIISKL